MESARGPEGTPGGTPRFAPEGARGDSREGGALRVSGGGRRALAFGLLGGAIAWTVHLLGAYAISEWGCVADFARGVTFLGIAAVPWMLIVLTALTAAVAAAATAVAHRMVGARAAPGEDAQASAGRPRDARGMPAGPPPAAGAPRRDEEETGAIVDFSARTGRFLSGLFLFTIVVESIPIFYWLEGC